MIYQNTSGLRTALERDFPILAAEPQFEIDDGEYILNSDTARAATLLSILNSNTGSAASLLSILNSNTGSAASLVTVNANLLSILNSNTGSAASLLSILNSNTGSAASLLNILNSNTGSAASLLSLINTGTTVANAVVSSKMNMNVVQIGTVNVIGSPCETAIPTPFTISQVGSTKIISQSAAKKNYICNLVIVAGAAEIVNIVEGTGTVCTTNITALAGSTVMANGMSFAANGGFAALGGKAAVITGNTVNTDTCIGQSGTNRLAGWGNYVQQ